MRRRSAVLVVAVAAVLGTGTGAVLLPDGAGRGAGRPAPAAASASAAPSTPPGSRGPGTPAPSGPATSAAPSPSSGDAVSGADLLTADDFRAAGLPLTEASSDVRMELVDCGEPATLDVIARSGPPAQRTWERGTVSASEQAVASWDAETASDLASQVLRRLERCQHEAPTHWVYGPTHTERLGPQTTASWLGTLDGTLNTSGRAPRGARINGGVAVLRQGAHVAVLSIAWCTGPGDGAPCTVAPAGADHQLAELSRTAARRL